MAAAARGLHQVLSNTPALMDMIQMVHTRYVVVAGLGHGVGYQTLDVRLPDTSAERTPSDPRSTAGLARTLNPRNQNFTAFVRVAVPKRTTQYRLQVAGPPDTAGAPEVLVSMLTRVAFDPPRETAARDSVSQASVLLSSIEDARGSNAGVRSVLDSLARFAGSIAYRGLGGLVDIVEQRRAIATGLTQQWKDLNSETESELSDRADELRKEGAALADLRSRTQLLVARANGTVGRADVALSGELEDFLEPDDLDAAGDQAVPPAAPLSLLSTGVISGDVARVRVSRHHYKDSSASDPSVLELLVALSDERPSYGGRRVIVSVVISGLIAVLGCLLFEQPGWILAFDGAQARSDDVLGGKVEPVVAVLLLVPGFTLTLINFPARTSLPGRLRFAGRMQVYATSGLLFGWAGVLAATASGRTSSHQLDWAVATGRAVFAMSLVCAGWVFVAWNRHQQCHRHPKGVDEFLRGSVGKVDAHFDLTERP